MDRSAPSNPFPETGLPQSANRGISGLDVAFQQAIGRSSSTTSWRAALAPAQARRKNRSSGKLALVPQLRVIGRGSTPDGRDHLAVPLDERAKRLELLREGCSLLDGDDTRIVIL